MSEQKEEKPAPTAGADADAPADYESATARLDEIIARLDSGDAQLRETLDLCAEAKTLIEYCATELAAVDEGLKELRLEDLAASLQEPGRTAEATSGETTAPEAEGDSLSPDESAPPPEEPPF